ncbi:MAG: hypothetical protein ACR2FH_07115 [Caulobacteraceae bacterium]
MSADRPSREEIERIGQGLIDRTYPAAHFHHREHILATAYLVRCAPGVDLYVELPKLICCYNVAMGGKNTDAAGYHHTITMFYLDRISRFLARRADAPLDEACADLLASPIADKDYPLGFYSRQRLFSKAARRGWVAPDLGRPGE